VATGTLELDDIQGLVVRGYGRLKAARYVLARIDDPRWARAWLGGVADRVDNGVSNTGDRAINLAVTASGLRALGLSDEALAGFSIEFVDGMTADHRRRVLGDVDESAPELWSWGGPGKDRIDLLLCVFAIDDAGVAAETDALAAELTDAGIYVARTLDTVELASHEHFGFRDGVSQPLIQELGPGPEPDSVKAGEFVLGYPNEYGRLTDRPLVPVEADSDGVLPASSAGSDLRDLGRNGSYLVFRQLSQDVHQFWEYCERAARRPDGTVDPEARVRLAAKMMGRWPSGAPLTLTPDNDRPEIGQSNDFGYHADDPDGLHCPIGSHVRRANPRDSLDPDPGSPRSIAVNKRHRILRRGRKYGALPPAGELLQPSAHAGTEEEPHGLHFICLVANIARQFEFVQHTWMNNPRFAGLYDSPDPLMGPATERGRMFSVPTSTVRERYAGIPRFVTVRGGAYFFLPGIRGLRYLATF
jgi:Dyp-type peroxidase family